MNHEEWLERADIYALGALDGEERLSFEAHLAEGCSACEDRLREARESLTVLPRSLTLVVPPPAVKARLLDRIALESPPSAPDRARSRPRWIWWSGWGGALAAAGLLVAVSWSLSTTRDEVERLRGRMAVLQGELAEREETLRLLSDPQVRYVSLAGLKASPAASGWLLWNPVTRRGLLLTRGLPAAPADRTYELWALAGAEPVPAGVFTVDPAGRAVLRLPPLPESKAFDKFAVTLEPAGGVATPTGPMHLLGSL